ncbi:DNA polymerase III subunit beta [Senegalia massiliensis]|nr:DNA polymerase III subunit beta [Senegalia massiliensis]
MKIIVSQKELAKGIKSVARGVSAKTSLPILQGIKIVAKSDYLFLTGTNLDLTIETKISCEIIKEGGCVLDAKMLSSIISKLPSDDITISVEDGNAIITNSTSKFELLTENVMEFPEPNIATDGNEIEIETDILLECIRKVFSAISDDNTRPILTGAKVEIENNTLTFVALDGYRLAYKSAIVNYDGTLDAVIPKAVLNEINRILTTSKDIEDTHVTISSNLATFRLENTRISTRLLEGQFIDYKQLLKDTAKTVVTVNVNELKNSIERATILGKNTANNLVKLSFADGKVTIKSNSEIGKSVEELETEKFVGEDTIIAFNSMYLLDGIKGINSNEVKLYIDSSVQPMIMRESEDEKSSIYLVLPVRLNN